MRRMVEQVSMVVLMFLFVYNLSFISMPSLSTARIAVLVLFFIMVLKRPAAILAISMQADMRMLALVGVFLVGLIYSFGQQLHCGFFEINCDSVQTSRFLHFFIYAVIGAYLFVEYSGKSINKLLLWFFISSVVQALFIVYSYVEPGFQAWVSAVLVKSGNVDFENAVRASGLTNGSGSSLSLIQGLGCFSGYCVIGRTKGIAKKGVGIASLLLVLLSTVVTGRTGMFVGAFFTCLVVPRLGRNGLFVLGVLVAVLTYGAMHVLDSIPSAERTMNWAFELLIHGESSSVGDLRSMPIPPLSLDTVVGTGHVSLPDGSNASGHDSGYIQTYYAVGLLMAAAVYAAYFLFFLHISWKLRNNLLLLLTLMSMVLEVKEPFIFKYTLPFIMFCMYFCSKEGCSAQGGRCESLSRSGDQLGSLRTAQE